MSLKKRRLEKSSKKMKYTSCDGRFLKEKEKEKNNK